MKKILLFCLILNVSSVFAFEGNKKLYNMKIGDVVGSYRHHYPSGLDELTTSYLNPEHFTELTEKDDPFVVERLNRKYSPYSVIDGKLETCWAEGVDGDGIGEVILIPCNFLDCTRKIEIFTGCAKTKDLWEKNNRPRNVKLFILESKSKNVIDDTKDINNYICEDITVIDEQYATLKDVYGWQEISLDLSKCEKFSRMVLYEIDERETACKDITDFEKGKLYVDTQLHSGNYYFLGIQILSVYKGTKYQDTCISEIRIENYFSPPFTE